MSKRFIAFKNEFKKHGITLNNRKVRYYLHRNERQKKMVQRFIKSWLNRRTDSNTKKRLKSMKTELIKGEITKKSVTKFFKYILDYDFKQCNCYKYLIFSGEYDFCFLDKSIIISFTNNLITTLNVGYKDINHIEIDIGEDDNIYLVIECINGISITLQDNKQIKFSEEVKAALYGN